MSILLRAALILVSALVTVSVTGRIRKARMQIEDAVFWVLFSLLLVVLAIFPRILYFFTELLRMQSPANLLFLAVIGLLFLRVFSLSVKVSLLEEKLKTLAQNEALKEIEALDEAETRNEAGGPEGGRSPE